MNDNDIKRINELYHKSKGVGLTPEEKEEQDRLRKEYIASIRKNVKANLRRVSILEPDGSVTEMSRVIDAKDRGKNS